MRRPIPNLLIYALTIELIGILLFLWFALSISVAPPHTHRNRNLTSLPAPPRPSFDATIQKRRKIINGAIVAVDYTLQSGDNELLADGDAFFSSISIACPSVTIPKDKAVAMCGSSSRKLLIIHRYLLDITDYVKLHPGGKMIEAGLGKDNALELFMQHHRARVGEQFSQWCIGTVVY